MIWDVVKASVHQSKERICREMFPSFGGNVRHGEPCYVNGQSFMCMGYFRTHSYAKATGMSRWVLDFMARRELLMIPFFAPQDIAQIVMLQRLDVRRTGTQAVFGDG